MRFHASGIIYDPKAIRKIAGALDELLGEAARHAHVFHRADCLRAVGRVGLDLFDAHDFRLREGEAAVVGDRHSWWRAGV